MRPDWRGERWERPERDAPNGRASNARGTLAFAGASSTQVYLNLRNNTRLDSEAGGPSTEKFLMSLRDEPAPLSKMCAGFLKNSQFQVLVFSDLCGNAFVCFSSRKNDKQTLGPNHQAPWRSRTSPIRSRWPSLTRSTRATATARGRSPPTRAASFRPPSRACPGSKTASSSQSERASISGRREQTRPGTHAGKRRALSLELSKFGDKRTGRGRVTPDIPRRAYSTTRHTGATTIRSRRRRLKKLAASREASSKSAGKLPAPRLLVTRTTQHFGARTLPSP